LLKKKKHNNLNNKNNQISNKIIRKNQIKKLLKKQLLNKRKLQQNLRKRFQEFRNKANLPTQKQLKSNRKVKSQMDNQINKTEMIRKKTIFRGKLFHYIDKNIQHQTIKMEQELFIVVCIRKILNHKWRKSIVWNLGCFKNCKLQSFSRK
jgi:hypothetical protein